MSKRGGNSGARAKGSALWRGGREGLSPVPLALGLLLAIAIAAGGALLNAGGAAEDEPQSAGLVINELSSDGAAALATGAGRAPDWIELRNAGSEPVELGGCSLVLGDRVNRIFSLPGGTLAPGACALVYCEGNDAGAAQGDWSAPFRLPASGGEELVLLSSRDAALDRVVLPELGEGEVYARSADGEWEVRNNATPGADNAAASGAGMDVPVEPGEVELSEISAQNSLYFPDEDGACHDYVELHNASGADVDLSGWSLSDDAGRLGRWSFPEVILPAGGYLVVHCSGLDRSADANHLHADFRIGAGETVYLSRPDGRAVSAVTPPELLPDQAWSLVDGEWSAELAPTPGAENSPEAAARINAQRFGGAAVRLNEIMALPADEPSDWIELYNPSDQPVDLGGWGLTDTSDRPRKWQFPAGASIQPGAYMAVPLGGSGGADFSLGAEGGYTVALSDPSGAVLDAAYLPPQASGTSYGRAEGEDGFFYFESGTPQAANAGARYRAWAREAAASVPGGLYQSGDRFEVELRAPEGSRVHYTLDGSDPDEGDPLYNGPIPVSGTTILRSRVYRDGCLPSRIDTQSYLYDVRNESGVYVISLVTDENNLTGEGWGLTAKGNLMRDLEREAHVEIFLPGGERVISQGCGISLHGYSSRRQAIKSINVIARGAYGSDRFRYPLFSQRDYDSYQSILLRPSGEDQRMSFMRDSVLTSLMRGSSLMFQETEICVVYLNGAYYTLCYLRERINKYSICQFEGWEGMEDEIDIGLGNDEVRQGSDASYQELVKWAGEADMTTDEAFQQLDARIDVQNYIEYMAAEIFTGNQDLLNVRRYRNARADGKWRWALYDLDWGFYSDVDSIRRWLEPGGTGAELATDNTLFIGCMKNPTFRDRFLRYMGEQLAGNFSAEYVEGKFRERYERIAPMLDQLREQWGYQLTDGIGKVVEFARTRPEKLIGYFQGALELSNADMENYFGAAMQKIRESKGES